MAVQNHAGCTKPCKTVGLCAIWLRDCGIFLNILKGGFLSEYCNPSGTVVRGAGRTAESAEPNPGNAVLRLPRIVQRPGPGL